MYNLNSIDEEILGIKDDNLKEIDRQCNKINLPPALWLTIRIFYKRWSWNWYLVFILFILVSSPAIGNVISSLLFSILFCLLALLAEIICELIFFQPIIFLCKLFRKK
jgi:hypothetical protein